MVCFYLTVKKPASFSSNIFFHHQTARIKTGKKESSVGRLPPEIYLPKHAVRRVRIKCENKNTVLNNDPGRINGAFNRKQLTGFNQKFSALEITVFLIAGRTHHSSDCAYPERAGGTLSRSMEFLLHI
jgi:hypothetical protein